MTEGRRSFFSLVLGALFVVSIGVLPSSAFAIPFAGSGKVLVTVRTVLAKSDGAQAPLPEALRDIESALAPFQFKSYELRSTEKATLEAKSQRTLSIEGGHSLTISVANIEESATKVHVRLVKGEAKKFEGDFTVKRTNPTFIIAGWNVDGGKLLIPVTVGAP